MTREIITVTAGPYSHFIQTHYLNSKVSSNSISPLQKHLIVDGKGAFDYEIVQGADEIEWDSNVEIHRKETLPKDKIDCAADISKVNRFYDPRSKAEVNVSPFVSFTDGVNYFMHKEEELIEEKMRWILETCDCPQGVVTLCDLDGSYCGIASGFVGELKDDMPKLGQIVLGMSQNGVKNLKDVDKAYVSLNAALSLSTFSDLGVTYVPVWNEYENKQGRLRANMDDVYHISALMAVHYDALMTILLDNNMSVNDFENAMTGNGNYMDLACLSGIFDLEEKQYGNEELSSLFTNYSCRLDKELDRMAAVDIIQGAAKLQEPSSFRCLKRCAIKEPVCVREWPFDILSEDVETSSDEFVEHETDYMNCLTSFHTGAYSAQIPSDLLDAFRFHVFPFHQRPIMDNYDMSTDSFKDLEETLTNIKECYRAD